MRTGRPVCIIWVYLRWKWSWAVGAHAVNLPAAQLTHIFHYFGFFNSHLTPLSSHLMFIAKVKTSLKLKSGNLTSVFPVVHVLLIKGFLGTCSGYTPPGLNSDGMDDRLTSLFSLSCNLPLVLWRSIAILTTPDPKLCWLLAQWLEPEGHTRSTPVLRLLQYLVLHAGRNNGSASNNLTESPPASHLCRCFSPKCLKQTP